MQSERVSSSIIGRIIGIELASFPFAFLGGVYLSNQEGPLLGKIRLKL